MREHVPIRRTSAAINQVAASSALRQEEGVTIHVERAVPDASDFETWTRRAEQWTPKEYIASGNDFALQGFGFCSAESGRAARSGRYGSRGKNPCIEQLGEALLYVTANFGVLAIILGPVLISLGTGMISYANKR